MTSNEAISILAFSGFGSHHMRKIGDNCAMDYHDTSEPIKDKNDIVYISDFSALSAYGVRRGLERYGAIAYFDKKKNLHSIYWSHGKKMVYPNEGKIWEHAKWSWKVTVMTHITAIDHFVWTHYMDSNALVKNSIKYLGYKHRLRSFIKPFTYNTAKINWKAEFGLINNKGMMQHIFGFNREQLKDALNYGKFKYKFVPIYDKVHPSMRDEPENEYPFYQDSLEYFSIMRQYVKKFINNHYETDKDLFNDKQIERFYKGICNDLGLKFEEEKTKDEFIDVLTNLFVIVTGFHEHVGTVSDFLLNPLFGCSKIEPNYEQCSKQNFIQLAALTTMTGLIEPDIKDDWIHLFIDKHGFDEFDKDNYRKFKKRLKLFQNEIDKRNAKTKYKSNSFNPKNMQTSVSV